MIDQTRNLNIIGTLLVVSISIVLAIDIYLTSPLLIHALLSALSIGAILFVMHIAKSTIRHPNYTDLLNQLDIGISILDKDEHILFYNNKALTLFRLNQNFSALPSTISQALNIQWKAKEHDGYQMTCIKSKNNEHIIIEYMTKEITIFDELRYAVIMRDATHRIAVDAELARYQLNLEELVEQRSHALAQARDLAIAANEEKNRLLANMTHELRTPLNAVLGYCELLQDDVKDHGHTEYLADLAKIHLSALSLAKLVNNVIDIQELEKGQPQLEISHFDIHNLIREVAEGCGNLIKANENYLTLALECQRSIIEGDENKIRKIVHSLISNAAVFTQNGKISITLRSYTKHYHDFIAIAVKDSGIGIEANDLAIIFEKFTQADSSTTRKYDGAGLGLTISKKLANIMGGDITVESKIAVGSIFTLHLPADATHSNIDPTLIRLSDNHSKKQNIT